LGARKKTSAAVACAFMQHIPKYVGEETDRSHGDGICASHAAAGSFLLRSSLHLPHKVAQKDQALSIHDQKGPERDRLTCAKQYLFTAVIPRRTAATKVKSRRKNTYVSAKLPYCQ
jgi:hypothetical protein